MLKEIPENAVCLDRRRERRQKTPRRSDRQSRPIATRAAPPKSRLVPLVRRRVIAMTWTNIFFLRRHSHDGAPDFIAGRVDGCTARASRNGLPPLRRPHAASVRAQGLCKRPSGARWGRLQKRQEREPPASSPFPELPFGSGRCVCSEHPLPGHRGARRASRL